MRVQPTPTVGRRRRARAPGKHSGRNGHRGGHGGAVVLGVLAAQAARAGGRELGLRHRTHAGERRLRHGVDGAAPQHGRQGGHQDPREAAAAAGGLPPRELRGGDIQDGAPPQHRRAPRRLQLRVLRLPRHGARHRRPPASPPQGERLLRRGRSQAAAGPGAVRGATGRRGGGAAGRRACCGRAAGPWPLAPHCCAPHLLRPTSYVPPLRAPPLRAPTAGSPPLRVHR